MYPHIIRLRGPWDYQFLEENGAKGTLTMPEILGSTDHKSIEPVEFRRGFQWVSKLDADERVLLCLDRVMGRGEAFLNGEHLGPLSSVWGCQEFDITNRLQSRNVLKLWIPALDGTESVPIDFSSPASPYGSLLAPQVGLAKHPARLRGVLGDVFLQVGMADFTIDPPLVWTNFSNNQGSLELTTEITVPPGMSAHPLIVSLTLDGELVCEECYADRAPHAVIPVRLSKSGLEVTPWQHRSQGMPSLHEMTLEVRCGGVSLWQESHKIGFRNAQCINVSEETTVNVWPAKTFLPNLGEDPNRPFQDWTIAQAGVLHVRNHIAPDSVYRLCDRAGIWIWQDIPCASIGIGWESTTAVQQALRRLTPHPCIVGWNLLGTDSQMRMFSRQLHDPAEW